MAYGLCILSSTVVECLGFSLQRFKTNVNNVPSQRKKSTRPYSKAKVLLSKFRNVWYKYVVQYTESYALGVFCIIASLLIMQGLISYVET